MESVILDVVVKIIAEFIFKCVTSTKEVVFSRLFVSQQDNVKTTEQISTLRAGKTEHGPKENPLNLAQIRTKYPGLFLHTFFNNARWKSILTISPISQ